MASRATVKRGTPARARKPAAKRATLTARLGLSQAAVQRAITWSMLGLGAAVALIILQACGVPAMAGNQIARAVGDAGFEVKRVELTGIKHMDRLTVYAIAFDQHSMAMPQVDLEAVRGKLLRYGWVQDARVSRRLPDTLVVDIVERTPAAVWQYQGRLRLVDAEGVVLEDVSGEATPDLPLLIGPNANRHARSLAALVAKAPSLKPVIAGATWIGERRWDLRFQSGETLALPEGEEEAQRALIKFGRMDTAQRLLGRGFLRFDMRDPTRFVARVDRQVRAIDGSATAPPTQPAPPTAAPSVEDSPGLEKVNDTI